MESITQFLTRFRSYRHKSPSDTFFENLTIDDQKSRSNSEFFTRSRSYHPQNPTSTFFKKLTVDDYKSKSKPSVVLYVTSLQSIRRTFEDCSYVRSILRGFHVAVDERDVAMDSSFRKELKSLLKCRKISLPQLFIGGRHIGGADEVRRLYEYGLLEDVLEGVRRVDPCYTCRYCGGVRFVLCLSCNGSKKVYDEDEDRIRWCDDCNENGLLRCFNCF